MKGVNNNPRVVFEHIVSLFLFFFLLVLNFHFLLGFYTALVLIYIKKNTALVLIYIYKKNTALVLMYSVIK